MAKLLTTYFFLFSLCKIQASLCPVPCKCQDTDILCSNSGLVNVPQSYGYSPAKYLSLGGNFINSFGPDDFMFYTKLNRLYLQYNSISSFSPGSFVALKTLKELYLGNNRISVLERQSFTGLTNLLFLDLSKNQLSDIPTGTFNGLVQLTRLRLSGNAISAIPGGVFAHLEMLQYLHLDGNKISSLSRNALKGLGNLCELHLSNNTITTLSVSVFKHLSSLSDLQLNDNGITSIKNWSLMALTELKSLSLSNNRISEIEAGTFKGLTNLQVLKLNGNNISAVGKQALSPCLRTQEVDLSNNIILAVEESAFEGLSSLRTLKLNHNKLTSLSPGVFTTNVRLSTLNLSDNPWHCNCALLDLKDWLKFSSERMLAVFVMCAQPQSLKGRYLDLISSELIKSADTGCMDMMLSDEPSGLSKPTGMPEISVMPTLTFTSLDLTTADGVRKIESKRHIVNTDLDQHFTTEATPSKNTAMIQTLGMATGQLQPKDFSAKDACSYNQMGIVNISARLVTSNSAKIVWTLVNTEHQHAYFRIMYDQFDGDIRFSRFINIKQGNVCILRDLRPSTAYFVCVESVVNETVCPVASRDLCVGIVTKDEKRSTLDPQTLTLYISAANAVAVAMTLIIIIGVIILKNRKRKSGDTVSMVYSQHRQVSCAVCVGQPSDYNSGYQSNSSQTGTYQPNEIDAIDLPQGD